MIDHLYLETKCKNCGHARLHHHRLNDERDICDAIKSRVPMVYCDCKKFKESN